MKYLVVGLGNIGSKYAGTRHNIGFTVLDALAEASNTAFSTDRYGDVCQVRYKGRTAVLLKPSTYMNLSGNAVRYWMQKEKIEAGNVMVILDDIALPFGTIRIRKQGNDGGHNGLRHINETLGTTAYPRLRFGIGGDFPKGMQVEYVLARWTPEEKAELPGYMKQALQAVYDFTTIGIDRTMNVHNTKKEPKPVEANEKTQEKPAGKPADGNKTQEPAGEKGGDAEKGGGFLRNLLGKRSKS